MTYPYWHVTDYGREMMRRNGMTSLSELLGLIPAFLDDKNPDNAAKQFDSSYAHGGGWHKFDGFELSDDNSLTYPGDPVLKPLAETRLRDEKIFFYNFAWVSIVQPDGSFEVSRMD